MSAGGIAYFVLGLLFFAFFYLLFGGIVDKNVEISNDQMYDDSLHTSQLRMDSIEMLTKYWLVIPFIFFIIMGFMLIKNALREQTGEVY
jgi:uncharacterized protein with PQ loop repeat